MSALAVVGLCVVSFFTGAGVMFWLIAKGLGRKAARGELFAFRSDGTRIGR